LLGENQYFYKLYNDYLPNAETLGKIKVDLKKTKSRTYNDFLASPTLHYKWGKKKWISSGSSLTTSYKAWIVSKKTLVYGKDPKSFKGYVKVKVGSKNAKIKSITILQIDNYKTNKLYKKTIKGNNKNSQTINLGKYKTVDLFLFQPWNSKIITVKYTYDT